MLRTVQQFASDNGLKPYLPEQTGWHQLTNRDDFEPSLTRFFGASEAAQVQITATRTVSKVFRMQVVT